MSDEPFIFVGRIPGCVKPGSTVTWAPSFTGAQAPRVIPADDHVIVTAGYAINGRVVPECEGPGTLTLTPTVTRGYASQTLESLVLEGDAPSSMWEAVACYEGDSYTWWPRAPAAFDPLFTSEALVQWRYPGGAWQTLNFARTFAQGQWITFHNGPVQASWGADPYVFIIRSSDRTYREIYIQPIGANDIIATCISEYRIFAPGATDPAFQAAVVFDRPMIDAVRGQVNTPIAAALLPGSLPIEPLSFECCLPYEISLQVDDYSATDYLLTVVARYRCGTTETQTGSFLVAKTRPPGSSSGFRIGTWPNFLWLSMTYPIPAESIEAYKTLPDIKTYSRSGSGTNPYLYEPLP